LAEEAIPRGLQNKWESLLEVAASKIIPKIRFIDFGDFFSSDMK